MHGRRSLRRFFRVSINTPPKTDEFELSIFGPGIGECIVIHVGDGRWLVVDSCVRRETKEPVALSYLTDLGVDIAGSVKVIVVTHWHDDHMEGVSALLEKAPSALLCCSMALRKDEFVTVVSQANDLIAQSSDVAEMSRVFEILKSRHPSRSTTPFGSVKFSVEDMRLVQDTTGSVPFEPLVT